MIFSEEEESASFFYGDFGHCLESLHGSTVATDHHLAFLRELLLQDGALLQEFLSIVLGIDFAGFGTGSLVVSGP